MNATYSPLLKASIKPEPFKMVMVISATFLVSLIAFSQHDIAIIPLLILLVGLYDYIMDSIMARQIRANEIDAFFVRDSSKEIAPEQYLELSDAISSGQMNKQAISYLKERLARSAVVNNDTFVNTLIKNKEQPQKVGDLALKQKNSLSEAKASLVQQLNKV